ncbi:hypothetical protein Leryth_025662 [Lithospermum erythrorhizon]|nr:hypothetical protein Leryth_025662 [Lithospermum erythrorhizon]
MAFPLFTPPPVTNKQSNETNIFGKTPDGPFPFHFAATKSASTGNTKQQTTLLTTLLNDLIGRTPLRENKEEAIYLKVAIEKKKNRVVFLECIHDFVDILFSFLTLPIGRIFGILHGKSHADIIGCTNNLYESVRLLDSKYFSTNACKEMLLLPGSSLGSIWRKLKLKVDEKLEANKRESGFSSEQSDICSYDEDQNVLVGSTSLTMTLLKRLGIEDLHELEIRNEVVKLDKLVQLLGLSFVSRSALTHWILSEKDYPGLTKADDDLSSAVETSDKHPEMNGSKIMKLVLYIRKSQNSVLYAECGADFVDCIFGFLAFPLGSVLKILDCNSQLASLDSLYESVSNLANKGHLKSEGAKNLLLCPKLPPFSGSDNQLLHIEEGDLKNESFAGSNDGNHPNKIAHSVADPKSSTGGCKKGGTYLKRHAMFMVTDDLTITLLSPTGAIAYLAKSNVPISDVDEAKELLKAALTSKTALTDVFRRKHETDERERLLHLQYDVIDGYELSDELMMVLD